MDDLVCTMASEDGLDLSAGVEFLKQQGLVDMLHAVSECFYIFFKTSVKSGQLCLSQKSPKKQTHTMMRLSTLNV